jgi:malonyl-CoA/methylmalonyl-CoA synthetase
VLGLPDDVRGELVGAVVALREPGSPLSLMELADWCRDKMPPYHVPRQLHVMESIPRNAMGKVNKKDLRKQISPA